MRISGKIVKWNEARGFGFIAADTGGPEVFVHISELKGRGGKPHVGERLSFEIAVDGAGRKKAVSIQRQRPNKTAQRRNNEEERISVVGVTTIALILIVVAALSYDYFKRRHPAATHITDEDASGRVTTVPASPDGRFKCDGRQHCSQMSSCDEARFFLRHCPEPKMDGDGDGEPCEETLCTSFLSR